MKLRLGIRKFLNKPGIQDQAYIIAEIEDTSKKKEENLSKYSARPHIKLKFSDCQEQISYDFDWDSPAERRNSLKKIDIMLETLTKFREALIIEQELYAARAKEKGWDRNDS